jgi:short-subunit dehydrogenase
MEVTMKSSSVSNGTKRYARKNSNVMAVSRRRRALDRIKKDLVYYVNVHENEQSNNSDRQHAKQQIHRIEKEIAVLNTRL